jgi:hypothetical protein
MTRADVFEFRGELNKRLLVLPSGLFNIVARISTFEPTRLWVEGDLLSSTDQLVLPIRTDRPAGKVPRNGILPETRGCSKPVDTLQGHEPVGLLSHWTSSYLLVSRHC